MPDQTPQQYADEFRAAGWEVEERDGAITCTKPAAVMPTPRPYTRDEAQARFLSHVWSLIEYWEREERESHLKLEGLAFSILSALDGGLVNIPGCIVTPNPHPDDKAYCQEQGENWYPEAAAGMDIAGDLYERFYGLRRGEE